MANPFYTQAFQGQPGQTAKAEQVTTEFNGVQAGFDGVEAVLTLCLQAPPGDPPVNALPAAAVRANKWLRFDNNGQPLLVVSPLNVRGAWAATTAYNIGDAYTSTPNGSLYYVKTAYTSGASFGATDLANTTLLVNLGGLYFVNNQLVTFSSSGGTLNCVDGGSYLIDSSGGNIQINLPTESALGNSPINLTYVGGSLSAGQAQTIVSASGQFIMGNSNNTVNQDVTNYSLSLMWAGSPYGWRLRTMG